MIEDYTAWKFWIDVLQMVATCAIGIYVWWNGRNQANAKRFKTLEDTVTGHNTSIKMLTEARQQQTTDCEKRLQRIEDLEKELNHLPSREEISKLSDKIGSLTEKLGTLDGRLNGINRAVDLLNQHHLGVQS